MRAKSIAHKIAYYTGKVAEYGSIHPAKAKPRSFRFRHNRLMTYKTLLHNKIESESGNNE